MSRIKQGPSTSDARPGDSAREPREVSAATGKAYWRSLDDMAETPEFKEFLHREFPAHASELLDGSRRTFLKLMGASIALAGAATIPGCRRPDLRILPYNQAPEHIVPGNPLYYATAMPTPGGGCDGVLAETHTGRPTKLEGNPLHPSSLGKSSLRVQASVLSLYDPDRDPNEIRKQARTNGYDVPLTSWEDFTAESRGLFEGYAAEGGAGLAFLVEKSTSPSRQDLRDRIKRRYPQAAWYVYEPIDDESAMEGSQIAFGGVVHRTMLDLSLADVVLCLDHDVLGTDGDVRTQGGFARNRFRPGQRPGHEAEDTTMSRLYAVESSMTLTGGQADHRMSLRVSRIAALAIAVGRRVIDGLPGSASRPGLVRLARALAQAESAADTSDLDQRWLDAVAEDLVGSAGRSVITAGPNMPPAVHALVHALNAALGNVGPAGPVRYVEVQGDAAASSVGGITALASAIAGGAVETLVTIGCNPVYDAPADLDFAALYGRVGMRIHLGEVDETAAAATHYLARAHYLESWNDAATFEGLTSIIQPMIEPLFDGRTDLELLAFIVDDDVIDPHDIVQRTMRNRMNDGDAIFEKNWRRTLHDGRVPESRAPRGGANPEASFGRIASAVASLAPSLGVQAGSIDVVFAPSPKVWDGRWANNGWLQELPDAITKVSWDNPAMISMRTAKRLGLRTGRHLRGPKYNHTEVITITLGGRSVTIPIWVQPGLPEDTVVLQLGYGREVCGRIGRRTGVDCYPLRTTNGMRVATGASVERAGKPPALLATTQDHWSMEGRKLLREVDLPAWQKYGDPKPPGEGADPNDTNRPWPAGAPTFATTDPYDRTRELTMAGMLGMESHTPANRSMYKHDQMLPYIYVETTPDGEIIRDKQGRPVGRENKYGKRIQQWGMSIDLTKCIGCGACTVACQAENNIPIVGKIEVANGREMHWIRIDRYYSSKTMGDEAFDDPDMTIQPVTCVHCESAPCEVVCPVNATVHGREGTNDMAYNRCIGTRYCSNNCPYKVRRFNYFDFATKEYRGGFGQLAHSLPDDIAPENQNWLPPRLRQPKAEVSTMQSNPHVTVRSRGVMEKCTYCIQRINTARVEARLADLDFIPDGFIRTACQQACAADAIVFGDIYDYESNGGAGSLISRVRNDGRTYALLDYLNTRPRTTYQLRVRNPNPAIREPEADPPVLIHALEAAKHGHGHGHDDGHGGGHDGGKDEGHVMSLPILQASGVVS